MDRTTQVIIKQLKAMNTDKFTIGILNKKGMILKNWTFSEVIKHVAWLKKENAQGSDIYVRPVGIRNIGLILLDDITQNTIELLKLSGFYPCITVETSPQNYQAWIRICNSVLSPRLATQISRLLAEEFKSDPNSADWKHFGRLAGFTNRKPQHKNELGQSPFVLLHTANQKIAEKGQEIIIKANQILSEMPKIQIIKRDISVKLIYQSIDLETKYQYHRLLKKYGKHSDISKIDWMIVKELLRIGQFTDEEIELAILQNSPEIEDRKGRNTQDYIRRTIQNCRKLSQDSLSAPYHCE